MKKLLTVFIFSLVFVSPINAQILPVQILGKWIDSKQRAVLEIYENKNYYYGKVVWLPKNVEHRDLYNNDKKLRNRSLLGADVLTNFWYNAKNQTWIDGFGYDPESGNTYHCKMWLNTDGTLSVRGYIGFSWLGRTEIMTRPLAHHECYK